jgi:hypothetical protein
MFRLFRALLKHRQKPVLQLLIGTISVISAGAAGGLAELNRQLYPVVHQSSTNRSKHNASRPTFASPVQPASQRKDQLLPRVGYRAYRQLAFQLLEGDDENWICAANAAPAGR